MGVKKKDQEGLALRSAAQSLARAWLCWSGPLHVGEFRAGVISEDPRLICGNQFG